MKIQMASQQIQRGQFQHAELLLRQVIADEPRNIHALYMLGDLYRKSRRPDVGIPVMRRVIACDGKLVPAYFALANMLADMGENEELSKTLEALARLAANNYDHLVNLGSLNKDLAYYAASEQALLKAIELEPKRFEAWAVLSTLQRDMGRLEDALHSNDRTLELYPDCARAYITRKFIKKFSAGDPDFAAMQALYDRLNKDPRGSDPQGKAAVAYTLGKAYEDIEDYERAFDYFTQANEIEGKVNPYNPGPYHSFFPTMKAQFSAEFVQSHRGSNVPTRKPIFVLGMPRSGTTLVENILAGHHQVYAAGELEGIIPASVFTQFMTNKPFPASVTDLTREQLGILATRYLNKLFRHASGFEYAVDKMPHNCLFIGFIKLLFPEARIIHCKRDAVATCMSIYKNQFGDNHPYSHNLRDLGEYYNLYLDLMQHWHSIFPLQIHDLQYEDLVKNPEEEIRALLNYCELPFDENCIHPHTNERVVTTSSLAQVREPISTKAVAQWEHYRSNLQPLIEVLGGT